MVVYTDLEIDLMEPREAARLYGDAVFPESVSRASVEGAFRDGGLTVVEQDSVATEWKEWDEEERGDVMGRSSCTSLA